MDIRLRKSNFSQFSKDLWLIVEEGNTRLNVEVDKNSLPSFALMLLNTVDDVVRKLQSNNPANDYDEAFELLSKLEEAIISNRVKDGV